MKYYDPQHHRLVYLEEHATPEFWDRHWESIADLKKHIRAGEKGRFVSGITKHFLPANSDVRILEGGCGPGKVVWELRHAGYTTVGVDTAAETIRAAKVAHPSLPVMVGNVEHLHFPNASFDGYWSLGVIEHYYNGYRAVLDEMWRVLKPRGYAFITFPYLSPIRKLKIALCQYQLYKIADVSNTFYQFALDSKTVIADMEHLGFSFVQQKPFDGLKGLKDECQFLQPPLQRLYDSHSDILGIIRGVLSRSLAPVSAHAVLLVFQKT